MSFFALTCIGVAAGFVHQLIPGERRLGPASAIALGVGGAWNGALFAATFSRSGWIAFGPLALAGAILGAAGMITAIELAARVYLRRSDDLR